MVGRILALASAMLVALAVLPTGVAADPDSPSTADEAGAGRYIVVLDQGDPERVAAEHARAHELEVRNVYHFTLDGYAARMSERAAQQIASDPRVAYIEADRVVTTAHHQCGHAGGPPGSSGPACENGDVYGTVKDADSEPIEGATVTIDDTGWSDTTDATGAYRIEEVEAGSYTVTADAEGYHASSTDVTVDGDVEVNFTLAAESGEGNGEDPADGQITPWGVERIGADDHALTGAGISVYVIDSGIDATHPDLAPNLGEGHAVVACHKPGSSTCAADWDDDHGHGTHVAGTTGAVDDPTTNVVGVAAQATLHAVKVLDRRGRGWRSDVIAGIDWVASHNAGQARVANMSLGGSGSKSGTCLEQQNENGEVFEGSDSYHAAICNATHDGVVFAVAAGNSGADAAGTVPAAYDDTVITVSALECELIGAHDQTCDRGTEDWPDWSNWGDDAAAWTANDTAPVAITAPGVNVLSTWPEGETHVGSGTSMAAPHVAGAAALWLQHLAPGSGDYTTFVDTRSQMLADAEDTGGFANTSGNPHDENLLDVRAWATS